ncbi:mitochondrial inner membrane protease subunit 2 isoform X5 [Ahaetulla prasina]|uniref:mitochondrial inner membrane protease subunit 2 isoform X5 n=1 Tax=Ahaetulla prasina TaxID=499056 RepID=UPI002649ABC0|nr:mitochondrial inner membrane protease subunit 2 isoform X5 [Ahaetulla prasina]
MKIKFWFKKRRAIFICFLFVKRKIIIQMQGFGRKYIKAFWKGFFVAVPVTVTFLDRLACIARVEGTSMQPSLNPVEQRISDIVLLNHWSIRNYEVQRGDIVSLVRDTKPWTIQYHCLDHQPSALWVQETKTGNDRSQHQTTPTKPSK